MSKYWRAVLALWHRLILKGKEMFRWNGRAVGRYQLPELVESLEEARREWRYAKLYFNSVSDPDLIDHAVFYMGATEKKYIYLLKQAREAGVNVEPILLA